MKRQLVTAAVALLLAVMAGDARGIVAYDITDIGSAGGFSGSQAWGINDNGQVVGWLTGGTGYHAFLWQANTKVQDLNSYLGRSTSFLWDINLSGPVVGAAADSYNEPVRWQNGGAVELLQGGGDAYAINDAGIVAGESGNRACIWQAGGTLQILGTLGTGGMSFAKGINHNGQVVGQSWINGTDYHAFLWQSGAGMQDLGSLPGGTFSRANAINDNAQVAGQAVAGDGNYQAMLWQNGSGMQDLGSLGGWYSEAAAINNRGQVVGYAMNNSGTRAFLWQDGVGMQDLNSLIDPLTGWILKSATDINNKGQIIGYGTNPGGQTDAFLLTPVALPGDANQDGKVDVTDLNKVLTNYNKTGMAWTDGDFDGNGIVEVVDLNKVLTNYDKRFGAYGGIQTTPEPGTAAIFFAGLFTFFAYRITGRSADSPVSAEAPTDND